MATIREHLDKIMREGMTARLEKLRATDAPAAMIAGLEKRIEKGASTVGRIKQFGDVEFTKVGKQKGYGGKFYLRFVNDSGADILYVFGKYGWYLYRQTPKEGNDGSEA